MHTTSPTTALTGRSTATSVAAEINGVAKQLGTLEAGKLADVIVVDGDPRQDIHHISKVTMTFVDGRRLV